jgi:hypothetical protein
MFPVTLGKTPAAVVLVPVFGNPVLAGTFVQPASLNPDVFSTIPIPVAGRPDGEMTRETIDRMMRTAGASLTAKERRGPLGGGYEVGDFCERPSGRR